MKKEIGEIEIERQRAIKRLRINRQLRRLQQQTGLNCSVPENIKYDLHELRQYRAYLFRVIELNTMTSERPLYNRIKQAIKTQEVL